MTIWSMNPFGWVLVYMDIYTWQKLFLKFWNRVLEFFDQNWYWNLVFWMIWDNVGFWITQIGILKAVFESGIQSGQTSLFLGQNLQIRVKEMTIMKFNSFLRNILIFYNVSNFFSKLTISGKFFLFLILFQKALQN